MHSYSRCLAVGVFEVSPLLRTSVFATLSSFLAVVPGIAGAAVTISSQPTQNMNCAGGVCAPTAKDAVLNADDLQNMLASGNATVTTTGSGVQANDITVKAPVSWNTGSALTLDAYHSLTIDRRLADAVLTGSTKSRVRASDALEEYLAAIERKRRPRDRAPGLGN
jgi:hypothetical protein